MTGGCTDACAVGYREQQWKPLEAEWVLLHLRCARVCLSRELPEQWVELAQLI
ncbi:MAG: hypothetical protein ACLTE2_04655 [Eubacteriales bacterium]